MKKRGFLRKRGLERDSRGRFRQKREQPRDRHGRFLEHYLDDYDKTREGVVYHGPRRSHSFCREPSIPLALADFIEGVSKLTGQNIHRTCVDILKSLPIRDYYRRDIEIVKRFSQRWGKVVFEIEMDDIKYVRITSPKIKKAEKEEEERFKENLKKYENL